MFKTGSYVALTVIHTSRILDPNRLAAAVRSGYIGDLNECQKNIQNLLEYIIQ